MRHAPDGLAGLWSAVVAGGGAVGFAPGDDPALIDAAAVAVAAAVRDGAELMHAATGDGALLGVVSLVPGQGPRVAHRGQVCRLMVHPAARRRGLGAALLDAAVTQAGELGLRTLCLNTRSGQGLEDFYAAQGWTLCGRWPAAVDAGDGDYRDDLWFYRDR